jgi:hypothetical protein
MIEKIHAPVSVTLAYDHKLRKVFPKIVVWEGNIHKIIKVGMHHHYRAGRTLMHVFSVISETLFFKLVLNTDTLHWTLEEIADGESN